MIAIPSKARPAGSIGALQFRDALGKFKGTSGLTFNDTANTLAFVGAAQTANNPLLDLSQTWNNAAIPFTGLRFNAIGGATSAAASKLLDLQLDGSSKFFVNKSGDATVGSFLYLGNASQYIRGTGSFVEIASYGATGVSIYAGANGYLGLSGSPGASPDALLFRTAANSFAQRNGVNAQEFRVYSTYTDANNGEWGAMRWNASVLQIGTQANGTGTNRNLELQTSGITRLLIGTNNTVTLGSNTFFDSATNGFRFSGNIITLNNTGKFGFSSTIYGYDPLNVGFQWGSSGVIQINSGTKDDLRDLSLRNAIQSPASSVTLSINGQFAVENTNNNTATFKLRGTDGVIRIFMMTLT